MVGMIFITFMVQTEVNNNFKSKPLWQTQEKL